MGIGQFDAALNHHHRIALDTSIFIYQLQANSQYVAFSERVFLRIEGPRRSAVTSTITMAELLVHPYRTLDQRRADEIASLLSTYPAIDWIAADLDVADLAAHIRADHQLKIPDALQAATAITAKATAIVTNDPAFKRVHSLEALVLDDFL